MRFRSTLILAIVFLGLGAYLYFVEFEKAAEEQKKETLFSFQVDDARAVALEYPDRRIELEQKDGVWWLTEPIHTPADETTVKNLLRAIADAEVKKKLGNVGEDLSPYGLEKPMATIRVTLKDRELPVIKVGKTSPIGFSTYVQRADRPEVYLTGSAFHSGMDKKVKDLRDKRILTFEDASVRRIDVSGADRDIGLSRKDDGWKLDRPRSADADSETVRSFLSTLRSMRALDFATDEPKDLSTYGLDEPRLTVTLNTGDENKPTKILVGGEEKEKKQIYVKLADRPTVYQVGDWNYRDLNKTANDFRDKTVLAFDKDSLSSVQVLRADGANFVLARSGDGKWSLEGSDTPPEQSAVDQFIGTLDHLDGYEIVTDQPQDLQTYGLASPALTITVHGPKDAVIGTVHLGSYSPNPPTTEYTAMREGKPTVFLVRELLYNRLDKRRSDLLPKPTPTATVAAPKRTPAGGTPTPAQ
jgi:hypothetical protein